MKSVKMLFLLLFIGGLGANTLYGQATTARLLGKVADPQGNGLQGATVVAVHEPTGTRYGTTTRASGQYTLPNLRVGGPYSVEVRFVGYKAQKVTGLSLNLAEKRVLNFDLEEETLTTDEVVITATNTVIDNQRTGAETNISNTQLRSLPTISRSAADFTRLTPASDGNSFGGRNDQFNNFSLDGSIFNNPFGLDAATPGGQSDAQPVSLDAIEQVQVSIAPYDVTQAGFTGAAVNAVTKSGTNEFHGTAFGFFRNQNLTGGNVAGTEILRSDLSQLQTGFSLGGPLVKDKVFFFANFELERRNVAGSNFVAAAAGVDGANVSRVTASDLDRVSQILMQEYGYETGPYQDFIHNIDNQKGIFKLDVNLSQNHTLTATYNFLGAFKEQPAHPSAIGRRGPDLTTLQFQNSGYRINNNIQSGIVELKSTFGNKASNKLQVGYTSFRDFRDAFSAPFPVVNINQDNIRYIVAGHEPFSINNVLDQDVFQITDNFTYYTDQHTLTLGTSFERFAFNNSFNLDAYGGTFGPGFASVDAFIDSVQNGSFDGPVQAARDAAAAGNWALAETNVGQWAVYVQDEWQATDNFVLTYGVRMDMPLYFNTAEKIQDVIDANCCFVPDLEYADETGTPITFDHTQLPEQRPLFSPRVGFNLDIKGDQTSQLRGGSGLFTGRFPFVWIGNQVANPNFFFYNVTRPDFRFPQVWRSNLGYDQKFGEGWVASLDVIYTKDVNAMMVRNYGIRPPSGTLSGPDSRSIYLPTDRTNDFANNAYVFTNTDFGYSANVSLQLQRNWDKNTYTSIAYNFMDAQDASSIEAEISSDAYDRNPALGNVNQAVLAPSLYGNRHRVVGAAFRKFEYGNMATTVSLFFQYAQGGRFSYTYSGDINGDGSFLNDLIYVPTTTELSEMTFAGDEAEQQAQRNAFDAFISQDAYLSGRRGQYAEKYAILSPWYSNWDMRILQDFNFNVGGETHTVQVSLDVLNIGNLLNSDWGVRQLPVNTQPIGVFVEGTEPTYSFDTDLNTTFTNDFSLLSRWQAQFGLRYIF